ncbi:hypothetical protein GCM10010191_21470 [Actinomadura vinacea]|uniref:Uncharacterized protein n=1 Tax=Actinomadura vinacea TaxID=115336 RepID=A0ABN3IR22_9ACTN
MPSEPVALARCATGRLRDAYPVNSHDVEVRLTEPLPADEVTRVLGQASRGVFEQEPHCRRVVFAVPVDDLATLAAAESAGFRYVVDVDLPGAELSLLVAEPAWVTAVDMDLDRVPGT